MGGQAGLFGRRAELDSIVDAVDRAVVDGFTTLAIEGEAGIGKSELMSFAATTARDAGFTVWRAKADEFERERPFGALRSMLEPHDPELADLVGGFATGKERHAAHGLLVSPEQSFQVIDRVLDCAEGQLSQTPLAFMIDDAQWADDATLRTIGAVSKRLSDRELLFVVAMRPVIGRSEHAALLGRVDLRDRIVVQPLSDDDVAQLVAERLGETAPARVLAEVNRGGGNPFFVVALLEQQLRERPDFVTTGSASHGSVPEAVRFAVLRQLDSLGDDVRQVVHVAAVLGGAFSVSMLAAMTDLTIQSIGPMLEAAVAARVLDDDGDRLRFRHDLVREILYESSSSAIRRGLHLEIGHRMVALGVPPGDIAEHFVRGAERGDFAAADVLRRSASEVGRVAPRSAMLLLERAAEVLPDYHPDHRACLVELAQWCVFANEIERGAELAQELLATTVPKEFELDLRNVRSQVYFLRGEARLALVEFEAMLPLVRGERREVVLLADAAVSALFAVELERARYLVDRALRCARVHDEAVGLTLALGLRSWLMAFDGNLAGAVAEAEQAVRSADAATGLEAHRSVPLLFRAQALLWADQCDEARAALRRGRHLSSQLGMGWDDPMYHALLADERTRAGQWDDALAEAEAGLARADEVGSHAADGWLNVHRGRILLFRGDLDAATTALDAAADSLGTGSGQGADQLWHLRSLLALASGDAALANVIAFTLWGRLDELGVRLRQLEFAPDVIRIARESGDELLVANVVSTVDESATRWPTALGRAASHWSHALAECDEAQFALALSELRLRDHPVDLARCRADQAARGSSSEILAASAPFDQWRALGLSKLHFGDLAPLKNATVDDDPRGWSALTPSEQRVVDLVAVGCANTEIAETLSISRRTVESHLYHAYPKLGLSSRVELAVQAANRLNRLPT